MQINKYTNTHKYSNTQIHKYTNTATNKKFLANFLNDIFVGTIGKEITWKGVHMRRKMWQKWIFLLSVPISIRKLKVSGRAEISICVTFSAHVKVSGWQNYLFLSQIPMRMLSRVRKGVELSAQSFKQGRKCHFCTTSVPLLTAGENYARVQLYFLSPPPLTSIKMEIWTHSLYLNIDKKEMLSIFIFALKQTGGIMSILSISKNYKCDDRSDLASFERIQISSYLVKCLSGEFRSVPW